MKLLAASALLALFASVGGVSRATVSEPPAGYAIVEENVIINLNRLPLTLLAAARDDFRNRNFGMASSDIYAASRLMAVQAKAGMLADGAREAASDLARTARMVMKGKITSERVLDVQLAQAAQQIAQFHQASAKQHWDRKLLRTAGHDLAAAATATERAIEWSGHKIARGTSGILHGARDVSGKLLQGSGYVTAEVGKTIDSLGNEVDDLGKRLAGRRFAE